MSRTWRGSRPDCRERLALLFVLLLALVARLVGLNDSLWYDEVFTLAHYVRLPLAELLGTLSSFNNHMFYSVQAKAAVALFGESAWALRVPALVFGLASLYVVWLLGRDAAGRVPALLATFLLAISYHHVWFSQDARGYTGLLFWTSLGTLLFVRGLQAPSWQRWSGYAVCVALGMYTHLSAALFFAGHAVVYLAAVALARSRPSWRSGYPGLNDVRPLYGLVLSAVATLLLYLPLIRQAIANVQRLSGGSRTAALSEWQSPLRTASEIWASVGSLGMLAPLALATALVLIAIGAVALFRAAPPLVAIYALHIPVTVAVVSALSMRLWPRYFFVQIGFLFLCLATGAWAVSERIGAYLAVRTGARSLARVPLLLAIVAMSVASGVLLAKNYAHPKQDFAGAVALVERERRPGDVAVSVGLASAALQGYYAPSWPVIESRDALQRWLDARGTVWLVTAFPSVTDAQFPEVMGLVRARFDLVLTLPGTLGNGAIRVYRSHAG